MSREHAARELHLRVSCRIKVQEPSSTLKQIAGLMGIPSKNTGHKGSVQHVGMAVGAGINLHQLKVQQHLR